MNIRPVTRSLITTLLLARAGFAAAPSTQAAAAPATASQPATASSEDAVVAKLKTRGALAGRSMEGDLSVILTDNATDDDLALIGQLADVNFVDVSSAKAVTDAGLKHLAQLARIKTLYIGGTSVTDDGLAALEKLSTLQDLSLNNSKITDKGLAHLQNLPHLEKLRLVFSQVTDAAADKFHKDHPGTEVQH